MLLNEMITSKMDSSACHVVFHIRSINGVFTSTGRKGFPSRPSFGEIFHRPIYRKELSMSTNIGVLNEAESQILQFHAHKSG